MPPLVEGQVSWALVALGPAVFLVSVLRWRGRVARVRAAILSVAIATVGVLTLPVGPFAATEGRNPVAADSRSIAAGQATYRRHCAECHGSAGRGDGLLASSLVPRPSDLTVHVPLLPDQLVFAKIRGGISGTTMSAWSDQLSDREIWEVVNFLRTLTH